VNGYAWSHFVVGVDDFVTKSLPSGIVHTIEPPTGEKVSLQTKSFLMPNPRRRPTWVRRSGLANRRKPRRGPARQLKRIAGRIIRQEIGSGGECSISFRSSKTSRYRKGRPDDWPNSASFNASDSAVACPWRNPQPRPLLDNSSEEDLGHRS
jgi:hypothetical protein